MSRIIADIKSWFAPEEELPPGVGEGDGSGLLEALAELRARARQSAERA